MIELFKRKFSLTDSGAKDLLCASIASFFVYCVNMLPVFLTMMFIDELILDNVKPTRVYVLAGIIILALMYFILSIEYEKLYNATYKEAANLRIRIAKTLSRLPISYFSKHDLSDLSQTIMSDVDGIEHAMSHSLPKVMGLLLFLPIISIFMLIGNYKLGLAVIVPTLVSFILVPVSKRLQIKGNNRYYNVLRENSELFQETIELQQEIQSFNLEKATKRKLYKKMEESEKLHVKIESVLILISGFSALLSFISLGVVIVVGISLYSRKEIGILYLLGYLLAAIKIKEAVDASKEGLFEIFYLSPKIERIKNIYDTESGQGEDVKLSSFDIELKNVEFSYDEGRKILNGVSFLAKQGEVTALVGESGCGKTSILRLISGLYDYDKGAIYIGGNEIKNISADSLFKNISIVFQDVTLFNTSILENIRIGRMGASDLEVKEAARLANCEEFILKLEKGYDTLIGENGVKLSGGERQRLSIARAFLKNAPILLLDEIVASLDVENEKKIQESLTKLIKNKTVIIISHRMKSIENVDKIAVISEGRVEAAATHRQLMDSSITYKNLIEKSKLVEDFVY